MDLKNRQGPSGDGRPEALGVLLEASSMMLQVDNEEVLLSRTLDLASNLFVADGYQVWRRGDDGLVWLLVAQRGLSEDGPGTLHPDGAALSQDVWIVDDVADERFLFRQSLNGRDGIRSAMVVPWIVDLAVHGAIVYYWRKSRTLNPDDVASAWALANLSLSALHRLELNEGNRRERQRLEFLAEASAVLASSLDYESTVKEVARLAVSQLAAWCTVHIAEEGRLTRLVVAHADPEMAGIAEEYDRRYPERIEPDQGVGKVFATGEPEVVLVITPEMLRAAAQDEDHLRLLLQLKLSSSIVVPLKSRERVLGTIRLLGTNGRYFRDSDVQLAIGLGERAATAIDNAQLHRALVERDTELRLSHAAAKMGSWTWDLERDQMFWSPEFRALHALPEDAVASGDAGYDLVHPEDRERAQREFWATLRSSATVFQSEHRSLTADGRVLWLQVRGRIRRNSGGEATWIAGLIIDVTESRIAEQALRRAEKLAAAGRIAATVAHEVNNPLEALMNTVFLAQQADQLPDEAAEHLRVADSELRRIAHIVRQTLGFYRESTVPQVTGLRRLVSEVLELYRPKSMTRGVTLCLSAESREEVFAKVISGEIKQVIANLVANAIDATPAGGAVQVCVARMEGCVEIAVSDTGCGVSETNRKRLFEPFFTTKADVGTGLGLWVSKGIVEKHGGWIGADNGAERGTTFRVRLPVPASSGDAPASGAGDLERETGIEPATFSLGS